MSNVIVGIGTYLPERIVTNDDLEAMELDYDRAKTGVSLDEWARARHGAISRHWARPGGCTSDMATVAARRALDDAGLDPRDVDVIVMATITNDYRLPQAAMLVQMSLGSTAKVIQLDAACSGFVDSLLVACGLLDAHGYVNALVVGADTLTRLGRRRRRGASPPEGRRRPWRPVVRHRLGWAPGPLREGAGRRRQDAVLSGGARLRPPLLAAHVPRDPRLGGRARRVLRAGGGRARGPDPRRHCLGSSPPGVAQHPREGRRASRTQHGKVRRHVPAHRQPLRRVDSGCAGARKVPRRGLARHALGRGGHGLGRRDLPVVRLQEKRDASAMTLGGSLDMTERAPVRRFGVVGAGTIGSGVVRLLSDLGAQVVVVAPRPGGVQRAVDTVRGSYMVDVERGRLCAADAYARLRSIRFTPSYADLDGVECVIESVAEDLKTKQDVLAAVEAVVAPDCIIGSNTSSIPIARVAATAARPDRVIGTHYFWPAHRYRLVEIATAAATSERTLRWTLAMASWQGKVPLTVRDSPGFFTTRILLVYLNEAMALVEEGASIESVDSAMKAFGWAMGPFRLMDAVGVEILRGVHDAISGHLGVRVASVERLRTLLEAGYLGHGR
ncbi:MAG: hypothetical protein E6J24_16315, partial [Chloroflexi bacterium]